MSKKSITLTLLVNKRTFGKMSKFVDVYGLGNAVVDISVSVSDERFASLRLPRGTSISTSPEDQDRLIRAVDNGKMKFSSGGSVGNSIFGLAELGGRGAFSGLAGYDEAGKHYFGDLIKAGIQVGNSFFVEGSSTSTCLVVVTPDGERTMRLALGAGKDLSPEHVQRDYSRVSRWTFIEGYLLSNGSEGLETISEAFTQAREFQSKVALAVSSPHIATEYREQLKSMLPECALVIANEAEAQELTGESSWEAAFAALKDKAPGVVVTGGARGALIWFDNKEAHVPALKVKAVDSTGAGDAFAAGLLLGLARGMEAPAAAKEGCELAAQVIQHFGARLPRSPV